MPVTSSDSGLEPVRLGTEHEGMTAITVAGGIVDNGLTDDMRQASLRLAELAENTRSWASSSAIDTEA